MAFFFVGQIVYDNTEKKRIFRLNEQINLNIDLKLTFNESSLPHPSEKYVFSAFTLSEIVEFVLKFIQQKHLCDNNSLALWPPFYLTLRYP